MAKTCAYCNKALPAAAKFCSQCGKPVDGASDDGVCVTRKRLGPTIYQFLINRDLADLELEKFTEAINSEINATVEDVQVVGEGTLDVTFEDLGFDKTDLEKIQSLLRRSYEEL
jgi:hypothetical protein